MNDMYNGFRRDKEHKECRPMSCMCPMMQMQMMNPCMGATNPMMQMMNPWMGATNPMMQMMNPCMGATNPMMQGKNPYMGETNPMMQNIKPHMGAPTGEDMCPMMNMQMGGMADIKMKKVDIEDIME